MRIYLDHNATTPVRDEVVELMARVLRDCFGNPSSAHAEGAAAKRVLEEARGRVAALVGAEPSEVVFTGSATEGNNMVVQGTVRAATPPGHVVTTSCEHPSVEEPLAALEAGGLQVTRLAVDADGRVDPAALAAAIRDDTCLVSVLLANNETGVLQDLAKIGDAVRSRGIPLHVDATQAVGKIEVDVAALGADYLTASAHKFNGPKGAGFLIERGSRALAPFVHGGPQERRRRGGTENLAGIAGLGMACALARDELPERESRYRALRDRLWTGLEQCVPRLHRNGCAVHVLPNTLNLEFVDTAGEILLEALDGEGVAVSAGAACASGSVEPSHVLAAMGHTPAQARGSLRLSVGHGNDETQIDQVLELLPQLVARVREIAS